MTVKTVSNPGPLLAFLFSTWPEVKRTRIKQWLRFGAVKINGQSVTRHDYALQPGDRVSIEPGKPPPSFTPLPEGLNVLFEDDSLLVVHKPPHLLTIATDTERERTAFRLLTDYLRETSRNSQARLWIVHRLDRETSGLLVLAKTEAAKLWLQKNWERMEKRYLAVVEGAPQPESGTLHSHIDESQPHRVFVLPRASAVTREAITHYRTLSRGPRRSLVELTLETGRRHQIRAQLAQAGTPIVGDTLYGAPTNPVKRIALHATYLKLLHPQDQRELVFESPLPPELDRLIPQPNSKA